MSESTEGRLVWPPTKEDLGRLYLEQRLSAAKIAKVYGLKYKSPKVAESTILYQLKKNGIRRRDSAEHIRKVTKETVDQWVERYQGGESLKQIAADEVSPVTVWNKLRGRGMVLRDKVEAQIRAVTKHQKRPFRGDKIERAYLMGLRYGDLHAVRHGRAIRVRVSTTHRAMADLFESLFTPYSHVSWYPRVADLVDYEWTLETDLDVSFNFLLSKPTIDELEALSREEMIAFLAGLFDAEGSIVQHGKRGRYNPEVSFTGTEDRLMEFVARSIQSLGLHCKLDWTIQDLERQGVTGYSRKGRVNIWRFHDVQKLLRILVLKHKEKIEKKHIVLEMIYRSGRSQNLRIMKEWDALVTRLRMDRKTFVALAKELIRDRSCLVK